MKRLVKNIILILSLSIATVIALVFIKGRMLYIESWERKEPFPEIKDYSSEFLLVSKNSMKIKEARMQLVKLTAGNLLSDGQIESGHLNWKIGNLWITPYVYSFISEDEVYGRFFNFSYFGAKSADGQPLFGVNSISKQLWNRSSADLSISQSALLMAINWAPSRYDPRKKPEIAIEKRNKIIQNLANEGVISVEDAKKAQSETLEIM